MAARKELEDRLGIYEDPADDLEIVRDRILPGSCRWILHRKAFQTWTDLRDRRSRVLWLTGLPGIGKSVLSGFIIELLQKNPSVRYCQYHFFKSEHQTKRSVGHMLRSIALQLATVSESFRERLLELYDEGGTSFGKQKLNAIWEAIYGTILFRQTFSQPIFWVLDGLDEADQPELLMRLLSKLDSSNTFRVLIISRMIRDLTSHLGKNIDLFHEKITNGDTLDDIRCYASSVISTIVPTEEAQEELCNKIYARAHSSFLWVKLALDQLRDNWHTHSDVSRILNDTPEGMEQLYVRMISIISEQAPRPKSIASRILTWMVCTFRPLEIAELETVLESEFGEFVSLSDTVTQICANFVVVEKSRVVLIHDTARDFLLHKTDGLSITIDGCSGNEYLATTCIRFLMDPKQNWRRILFLAQTKTHSFSSGLEIRPMSLSESHPFLAYAVIWWPYHVSLAATSEALMALVFEFLENTCLIWINAVALLGEMRDLARAAQYLKLFLKRKTGKTSHESLNSLYRSRDDDWRQWTKDLIRMVGRFGNILMQNPQSIYRYIIPFCPKESIIRRTYIQARALSVTGISSEGWDDCMTRLTMGNDEFATKIICMGAYFVTLVGSGTMVVWHADSCAEARRLKHHEWVTVMEPCKGLYWIATAGTKTIRVWDINSGEELFCIPKSSSRRIMALSFGKRNDELRIGYDDSTIQCYSLDTLMEKWRMVAEDSSNNDHACPHLVSFSPDGCQVLLGYRGKPIVAWSLDSHGQPPQKYVRPEDRFGRHQDSWKAGTPDCVEWLPERPIVFIIYNDTTLVEWNIEDDSQRELPILGAREMTISSDGNLLLTSDCTGTLSVWAVPEYRLIYRLKMEETVRGLAFSPNGQRLYDIRGWYCNVWEPDSLVRPDDLDQDELSSTQNTNLSEPVSSTSEIRAQITTLISDYENDFYCCGKDSGAVVLYEIKTGEKIRKLYGHCTVASITQLTWSKSRILIASADDCGRVLVKRLRPPTVQNASWAVYGLLDFRPGESVTQLLFDSSEEYLLVATSSYDTIWSLKHKKQLCHSQSRAGKDSKWINHPTSPETLILLNLQAIEIFQFASLKKKHGSRLEGVQEDEGDAQTHVLDTEVSSSFQRIELSRLASGSDSPEVLGRAIALDQSRTIFEIFPSTGTDEMALSHRRVMLLTLSPSHSHILQPIPALTGKYNRIIGTFQNHLVFLDRDYVFCTLHLDSVYGGYNDTIKQHFYLPKDWLSPETLALCTMNRLGTILCPKNGEVAVIQGGFREQ
jgi:WD40 repeat protein